MAKMILRAGKVAIKIILLFAILGLIFFSDRLLTPVKAEETNLDDDMVGSALTVPLRVNWDNYGHNRRWDNPANWNGGVLTAADKAVMKQGARGPIIDSSTSAAALQCRVGGNSADTLDMTGGTLSIGEWFQLGLRAANDGTFTISAGTVTVGTNMTVGKEGAGHMTMTGGMVTVSMKFRIALMGGTGHVQLDGGTISCRKLIMLTGATMDISSGTLIVNGDGTSTINDYINNGWLTAYSGSGTLNVDYNVTNPGKTTVTASATEEASYPAPANGVPGVSINADLGWTAGAYAVSHDVYFGTDPTPDATEFKGNQSGTTFDPGTMALNTTYYWRIDEKNALGTTGGDVWSFTIQTKASEIMEQFWAQYSPDERFVEHVMHDADKYLQVGEYEKAIGIYEYVLDNWTNDDYQLWGKAGVTKAHIGLGDDPNDQQLNELFTEFTGHPGLSEEIFYIAEEYYKATPYYERKNDTEKARKCIQKAISLWEILEISDSDLLKKERHFLTAESYRWLGQDEEAIEHYKEVITIRPDYGLAPHIHLMIAKGYERLKKSQVISESLADAEIMSSYQKAVEANPESPPAKIAAERLSSYQAQ